MDTRDVAAPVNELLLKNRWWLRTDIYSCPLVSLCLLALLKGRIQGGGGFKGFNRPRKKSIILFRSSLMNWLHTEEQTVPKMP